MVHDDKADARLAHLQGIQQHLIRMLLQVTRAILSNSKTPAYRAGMRARLKNVRHLHENLDQMLEFLVGQEDAEAELRRN